MLADDMPPTTRPMNNIARLVASAVEKKLIAMPTIEYSNTGRRPILSDSAPNSGMNKNWHKPKTVTRMPYQCDCMSRPSTYSPTSTGNTGTARPTPSISMNTHTKIKFRPTGLAAFDA